MPARTYPPFPIPCAAAVVMQDGEVLLIRRGKEPNYGLWSFPGGAIDLGETSRECAARETEEETGLRITILDVAAVVDREFRDASGAIEYQYVIIDYLACPAGGSLAPASDVLEAEWVRWDAAFRYDLAPPTGEVLEKAIRLWQSISPAST